MTVSRSRFRSLVCRSNNALGGRAKVTENILVICGRAKQRSLTAETIYANSPSVSVRAAGISKDADIPVTDDLLDWADRILVMESTHKSKLSRKFGHSLANKKIRVLNIPDTYCYMDPTLIDKLQSCIKQYT